MNVGGWNFRSMHHFREARTIPSSRHHHGKPSCPGLPCGPENILRMQNPGFE
jgi:hypothetical protein